MMEGLTGCQPYPRGFGRPRARVCVCGGGRGGRGGLKDVKCQISCTDQPIDCVEV